MARLDIPFNVEIMDLSKERLAAMRPVTSLDYFENVGGDLHDDGLFSVSIFGRIGDELRDKRFSFIDIKTTIFHPVIYERLTKLKGLYKGILAGTHYARWDAEAGDFVLTNELDGQTGYSFFLKHWRDIKFPRNRSGIRDKRIELIEKYRDRALVDKILVMPAGLRDIEQGDDGRPVVADINTIYRKILSIAKTIPETESGDTSHNLPRHLLQMAFNEIYDLIEQMLSGKRGFLQSKWGRRRVFNSTRNVITAMDTSTEYLGGRNAPGYNDTIIGLYQAVKSLLPVAVHHLKTRYLQRIFAPGNGMAILVEPNSLKSELVTVSPDTYDRWTTVEGLEKVISSYGEKSVRHKPVTLDGYYMALLYAPKDKKVFKVFSSIDELPEGFNREDVRPINLMELIYLSGYDVWNNYVGFVTRYPITGTGSCYPTTLYIKTTVVGEMRQELDENWQQGDDGWALEFPTYSPLAYLDSMVVPSTRLAGLGADFDGDTSSLNAVYSDEAVAEVKAHLNSKAAYVDPRGGLRASAAVDTVELVLRNMTG